MKATQNKGQYIKHKSYLTSLKLNSLQPCYWIDQSMNINSTTMSPPSVLTCVTSHMYFEVGRMGECFGTYFTFMFLLSFMDQAMTVKTTQLVETKQKLNSIQFYNTNTILPQFYSILWKLSNTCLNFLSQMSHLYGISPVCLVVCSFNAVLLLNVLLHSEHWNTVRTPENKQKINWYKYFASMVEQV